MDGWSDEWKDGWMTGWTDFSTSPWYALITISRAEVCGLETRLTKVNVTARSQRAYSPLNPLKLPYCFPQEMTVCVECHSQSVSALTQYG